MSKRVITIKSGKEEIQMEITEEEYDKSIVVSLIADAKVMGEDCMEVTWKYQDVYEKILGEMQQ